MILNPISYAFRATGASLATPNGQIGLLAWVLLGGMAGAKAGVPWAAHVTIATLSVVLVRLSRPDAASRGSRLAALLALMVIGAIGTWLQAGPAEEIVLSSFAVLLVVIQDGNDIGILGAGAHAKSNLAGPLRIKS